MTVFKNFWQKEDVAAPRSGLSTFNIERVFCAVAQVAAEVSVLRHQMLGDAHAESRDSVDMLSALSALHRQIHDVRLLIGDDDDVHGPSLIFCASVETHSACHTVSH